LFVVLAGAIDGELGVFSIEWLALLVEGAQVLAGGHNDAACIQIGYSVFDGVVVEVEVHDYANVGQVLHCLWPVDRAAACGNHGVLGVDGEDVILFDVTEGVDADVVDDLLEGSVLDGLNVNVGIDEVASEGLGEKDSNGALADTAHAYQDDVLLVCIESGLHTGDFIRFFGGWQQQGLMIKGDRWGHPVIGELGSRILGY
jgi:hypothetical protein